MDISRAELRERNVPEFIVSIFTKNYYCYWKKNRTNSRIVHNKLLVTIDNLYSNTSRKPLKIEYFPISRRNRVYIYYVNFGLTRLCPFYRFNHVYFTTTQLPFVLLSLKHL